MLEKREYVSQILKEHTMVNFRVDFVPTTLNNQEVYEVKNEHGHYCYMTPEMVDKIFELRPGGKNRYVDTFSFASAISRDSFVKLNNKILLDLPTTVNETTFDNMSFFFVEYDKNLTKEPVILKVQRQYKLCGVGEESGTIELILPDNKLECNNFNIYNQRKINQVLEINTKNSKMDAVFIDSLSPSGIGGKEVYLSVDFKEEEGILFIQNSAISSFSNENGHINFKIGKNFYLDNAVVKAICPTNDLSNVNFSSSKDIEIKNSSISLQNSMERSTNDQIVGIKGDGDIRISDSICEIHDLVINDGGLYISQKKKRGATQKYENKVTIKQSSFYSPTYLSAAKNRPLLIKEVLVDNGKNKVTINGNSLVLNSKILGSNNKPITISTSSIRLSEIVDTNNVVEALVSNAKVENCLIENDKSNKRNILIGPQMNTGLSNILSDEDREIKWTLKNCQISVDKGYLFRAVNFEGAKFVAENSTFNRGFTFMFYIDEAKQEEIKDFTFNIKNSLINRSSFSLAKGPYGNFSTTSVINSEINDAVIFSGLELLKDSIANYNTQLSGYSKVDSCFFDGGITKDAKDGEKELIGYNSSASTFVEEPKKDVGQAKNKLEIL